MNWGISEPRNQQIENQLMEKSTNWESNDGEMSELRINWWRNQQIENKLMEKSTNCEPNDGEMSELRNQQIEEGMNGRINELRHQ